MGSCVSQCDVPHQWIAQRQVGPVSVYCDGVWLHVLCLRPSIPVWQHIGQSTNTTRRHRRDMISDVLKRRIIPTNTHIIPFKSLSYSKFREILIISFIFVHSPDHTNIIALWYVQHLLRGYLINVRVTFRVN